MTIDQLSAEPDLEYTPIVVPLPALVRREELDAMRQRAAARCWVCTTSLRLRC